MDLRAAHFFQAILFTFSPSLLCPTLEPHEQAEADEFVPGSVQALVESEAETWRRGEPIMVTVKVKNTSSKSVSFIGRYALSLKKLDAPTALYYVSLVEVLSGTPLKRPPASERLQNGAVVWEEMEHAIHLGLGETKAMKFDLAKLFWYEFRPSDWRHRPEVEIVPVGRYDLRFNISLRDRRDSTGTLISTGIISNKVEIVVE